MIVLQPFFCNKEAYYPSHFNVLVVYYLPLSSIF